ncbi:MAG: hypothetical protein OXH79_02180 [Boseongicola sp.]|nr:hypothetical protein [Boseongicola sp.]
MTQIWFGRELRHDVDALGHDRIALGFRPVPSSACAIRANGIPFELPGGTHAQSALDRNGVIRRAALAGRACRRPVVETTLRGGPSCQTGGVTWKLAFTRIENRQSPGDVLPPGFAPTD